MLGLLFADPLSFHCILKCKMRILFLISFWSSFPTNLAILLCFLYLLVVRSR
jgi:hypothetical protein